VAVWPESPAELVAAQEALARAEPPPWRTEGLPRSLGGCFVCFVRGPSGPGAAGDRGWAGAAAGRTVVAVTGSARAAYEAGLLALREGPLLEAAVRALPAPPDVLLVNATGRDHPRRAGVAFHLGAVLDVPTVGVTHRTLLAEGAWPPDEPGAAAPLVLAGELVGYWLRTRPGTRPLAVHAGWRTDPETALAVVREATGRFRTPEPLRLARRAARRARAWDNRGVARFELTSDAFENAQPIPARHSCEGEDVSPALSWTEPPEGTVSLALVVDDPDAPGGTFTHWLAWGIDSASGGLAEGEAPPGQGRNDFGRTGYGGPCPPPGHGPHRYSFRLHALDAELELAEGASKRDVERALENHVLGVAELEGTYERR
jgi:deoxyribonuclease V